MEFTLDMMKNLKNDDGATLKNFQMVTYKTGYQVATHGIETDSPEKAYSAVVKFHGNCGIWLEDGIYYIDVSHREKTKKKALEIGRACHQKTILKWADMSLIEC